jgi:hypothetical protein
MRNVISSSLDCFVYRPERVAVGRIYHYVKSNLDGSYPAEVCVYVASETDIEVLKLEAHMGDLAYVMARMDWALFSAVRLQSWVITGDSVRHPRVIMELKAATNEVHVFWGDQVDRVGFGHYPVHVYNFDCISLILTFPHLADPDGRFVTGILQPTFDPNSEHIVAYLGEAAVEYIGDTTYHQTPCRQYRIGGDGFLGHQGMIWVNREETGRVEKIEIPIADNPDWDSFKFELVRVSQVGTAGWQQFINSQIGRLRASA